MSTTIATETVAQNLPEAVPHPLALRSLSRRNALDRPISDGILLVAWLLLSLAASTRAMGYSRDYFEYLSYYQTIPTSLSLLDTRFEPGFHLVSWIFRNYLDVELPTLILFLVVFSLAVKILLFRKYLQYPLLGLLIYTLTFYPIHEYTQYRVAVSLAFGYWAIHLVMERKLRWAALLFLLAFLFHYSSILILLIAIGSPFLRGRRAVTMIVIGIVLAAALIGPIRGLIGGFFNTLNPLSLSYLENTAMIEGVSLFSVNNLLLIGALTWYAMLGYYNRGQYHALFMTMSIACLVPIALLPDAPVIAQRSKEVLFVAIVFLSCRSKLTLSDIPGFALVLGMSGLLAYLAVTGGIIFA